MERKRIDRDLQTVDLYSDEELEEIPKRKPNKKKKKNKFLKELLINSLYILFVMVATLLIVRYVGQRTVVIGSSMEPTLSDSDNLIVDKITYVFSDPKRFDIIVFPFEYEKDTYYIKRIIGLPGETVRIDYDGNIYINEVLLEENYGCEVIRDPGLAAEGITLGEDEYFVLGDNRNHSSDSRNQAVGVIHRSEILGRAWLQIYPFSEIHFIKHA